MPSLGRIGNEKRRSGDQLLTRCSLVTTPLIRRTGALEVVRSKIRPFGTNSRDPPTSRLMRGAPRRSSFVWLVLLPCAVYASLSAWVAVVTVRHCGIVKAPEWPA